jgi:hypothetical protein
MTRNQLRLAFVLVLLAGVAGTCIHQRATRAGAEKQELKAVKRSLEVKAAEGKVVQEERVLAGKALDQSQKRTEISRPKALRAQAVIAERGKVGEVPDYLAQPITDLIDHTHTLERENADFRQLVTVDSAVIKNLGEQLVLKTRELDLTPKAPRCGMKCGMAAGGVLVLLILGAAK